MFKQQLKEWSELGQSAPAPDHAPEEESDIHSTPAGAWPSRGPKAADYCHVRLSSLCFTSITIHQQSMQQNDVTLSALQPGKLGIVFSYVSLVLCIIGIITMFKCTYIEVNANRRVIDAFKPSLMSLEKPNFSLIPGKASSLLIKPRGASLLLLCISNPVLAALHKQGKLETIPRQVSGGVAGRQSQLPWGRSLNLILFETNCFGKK